MFVGLPAVQQNFVGLVGQALDAVRLAQAASPR